jgi:large subunit ribosomal protein L24
MKLKKGDNVTVIAGKDRGKRGKILTMYLARARALVEGINVFRKHRRPKRQGEKGEVITVPRAIHISNVQFYCGSCGRGVRLGTRLEGDAKVRYCIRCKRVV